MMDIKLQEKLCTLRTEDLKDVAMLVIEMAADLFEQAGFPDDFCIQYIGYSAVFGGWNRVTWNPKKGWKVDTYYSTTEFTKKFNKALKEYE